MWRAFLAIGGSGWAMLALSPGLSGQIYLYFSWVEETEVSSAAGTALGILHSRGAAGMCE